MVSSSAKQSIPELRAKPGPRQQWGKAGERAHIIGRSGNRTVPKTLRAQYPLWRGSPAPKPQPNEAQVAAAPEPQVKGFAADTSREQPERRGAFERVFQNADGSHTSEFSASPLNYRRPDGSWAPIDSRLVRVGSWWHNTADTVNIRLADRAGPSMTQIDLDAEHAVGFGLAGAAAGQTRTEASAVTYEGALPDTDLRIDVHAGGVKETLVLRSPQAPTSFLFPLALKGLTPSIAGGQVVFTDGNGMPRAVIPAGFMWDSSGEAMSDGVTYSLEGAALRMTLDEAWLRDPARKYPVMADPTVDSGAADSSMVVHGSNSHSGGSELLVGRKDGAAAASYIKFAGLADRLRYHTVYGAQLSAVNFDSASCRARAVSVHPVTQGWSSGSSFSYPGPSVGGSLTSESFAYGYIAFGQSKSSCPVKGTLFNLGAAGRKVVQGWVDGQPNNGLSLRASSSDSLGWKRFAGSGTVNAPRLYVTHSPYNAKYAIPNPVPEPPVLQNQSGRVKITVTNLSAEAWTPGTYYLAYRAYNAKTGKAVTQQRSASLPGNLARNARVTLTAEIKPLPPGTYFLDFTMVKTGGVVFTDEQVPPGRIVIKVIDIPPVLQELYPPNGYQAQTLMPRLWARALDIDAPPGSALQHKFEVCDKDAAGNPVGCTTSTYQASPDWIVPAGRLVWSKSYFWRAFVKDATTEVPSPRSTLLTDVPQPAVTSRLAAAPYGTKDREFDPQVGNFSTAALDAPVTTVGPELRLVRTYNSLDPRRDSLFGAGWSTRYDMRLTPDNDGSGNIVIRYPDGQEVRFGKNPDGTFAAPAGRSASLSPDGVNWKLVDKAGSAYYFSGTGRLTKIADAAGRSIVLTYSNTDGTLAKAHVANSQTNLSGRSLRFTWSAGHVASVTTDLNLTWTYTYSGDLLTRACAPGSVCTDYTYAPGSHYRTAVQDAQPESYYRLGEAEGSGAGSEVAVNLGKDRGRYQNVTLGTAGAIAGSPDTAGTFNGISSSLDLPKGTVKRSRDVAVELWFKANLTGGGGPLLGYQDKAPGQASTLGVPVLYQGTDGRLRGQFYSTPIAPITSATPVNDGKWHHVVLSAMAGTQTLYLDGVKVGTLNGAADPATLSFNQVGAAYATTPASWPAWGTTPQRHYSGTIDEVAVYSHPLGPAAVAAHRQYGIRAADQVTAVTLPSGRLASEVDYDVNLNRVKEYTDHNGGTWKVGAPSVYGDDKDLRRGVTVMDPANRFHLYEYDALGGRMIRMGTPTGLILREEDRPGQPTPTPTPTPTMSCTTPDPGDPQFCTVIPPTGGGPVFEGHSLDGIAIRTFSYDERGFQNVVKNENGDETTMTYDDRGNVTSRKTCATSTSCHTDYYTYPATGSPFDPRTDMPTESRDGRSTGQADNRFRTTYTYSATGELATQINPDGSTVRHAYTDGAEPAVGGGITPPGLLASTTDARGAVTRLAYFQNGDLAQVTQPSGLITTFTYDPLGRKTSQTEKSDAFPAGLTTTYGYDELSRPATVTEPTTTDVVTGTRHQGKTTNTYDVDGNVVRVDDTDLLGGDPTRSTTQDYDEHNRVERVTDAEGNETSFGYDRFGNRTSMVDPNENRFEYAYTARNMLAEVRLRDWNGDPAGAPSPGDYLVVDSYAYDHAGRKARETDAMGHRVEYAYYGDDRVKSVTLKDFRNPDGSKRDYVLESNEYDGAGHLVRQVAGNGTEVTEHTINAAGHVGSTVADPTGVSRRTTFTYDLNGNVTRVKREGSSSNVPWPAGSAAEIVDFAYDISGSQISETAGVGTSTPLTTTHTFDQRGHLTSTTDSRGNVTGGDKSAFTTNYASDELGRQTTVTGPPVVAESGGGAPQTVRPTQFVGYNTFDEAVAAKDELGNITRVAYDKLGREVTKTAPTYTPPGTSTPITPTVRTTYDPLGNVTETFDARGNATRYVYDRLNRVTTRDEPAASNDERAVSRYTYTRTGEVLSVTDPSGGRVETTYDDLDRQITMTQVERHPVAANFTTNYAFDDAGNVTSTTTPTGATTTYTYNGLGEVTKATDPSGVVTQLGYDFSGRRVRTTDGLGRTTKSTYDGIGQLTARADLDAEAQVLRTESYAYDPSGNVTTRTDALGRTSRVTYDASDQVVSQTEPVAATESITTTFGYDAAGNRTRFTDGRGNATIYTVNSLGLSESVIEPGTTAHPAAADRTWTYSYDAEANPVRVTAPGGVTRQTTFDAAGRIAQETGAGAEAATSQRTIRYNLRGDMIEASAPGGTNTYAYNDRGGLLNSSGPSGTASFTYDGDGQTTARTDAAGTARYTYVNGRLSTVGDGLTATTQALNYDAAGDVKQVNYGAGRVRTFGYDDLGRVSSDVLANGSGQTVASATYGYDLNDHLTRKDTIGTADAGNNTYTYDHAGRMASWVKGGQTTQYGWDAAGNRVRNGAKTATFDARNRLMSDGDYTYAYRARGTLASKTSSGLTEASSFDAFDRLTAQGSVDFAYDGLDRVATREGTPFAYSGLDEEVVNDGAARYARGPDDEVLAIAQGTQKRVAVSDEHGDVVGGFDPGDTGLASLPDSTAYDPFGKVTATSGTKSNLGYQGDWTDPGTGRVNMGARWYSPSAGNFESRDTVDYQQGESVLGNRYTYGAAAPMDNTDPDGNLPCWKICGAAKKVAGAAWSAAKWTWNHTAVPVWNWGYKHIVRPIYNRVVKPIWNGVKSVGRWVNRNVWQPFYRNVVRPGLNWARQRAIQAARAAIAFKREVTRKAKAARDWVAKHNPIPAIKAAVKPLISGVRKVIKAAAHIAAPIVAVVRDVVKDVAKGVQIIYNKAVETAGNVVENVSKAVQAVSEFAQTHAATIAGVVAGAVVGVGCGFAIGWTGVGAVACGALAGVVGSLVTDLVEGGHSWKEMLGNALIGGTIGALTAGVGSVVGQGLRAGARAAFSTGIRSATSAALGAGRAEVGAIVRGQFARACNSFAGGTSVLMADGSHKPIEDVKVGNEVVATDPTTGKTSKKAVTDVITGVGDKRLVEVTVDIDGTKGDKTGTVTATDNHPFWVDDRGRWLDAKDLRPGDMLRTSAGTYVQVVRTAKRTAFERVHNLTVDGVHTYYIGAASANVLVHNCVGGVLGEGRRVLGVGMAWMSNRGLSRRLGGELPEANATVRDLLNFRPGNPPRAHKLPGAQSRSDQDLMRSVFNPSDKQFIATHPSYPGTVLQGNHRRFQLIDRANDPNNRNITWDTQIFINHGKRRWWF